jgi:hypothetical protein
MLRRLALVLAGLVTLTAAAGCGSSPPAHETAPPSTSTETTASTSLQVYLVRDGKLALAHRVVPATQAVATASVNALLQGPTATEQAAGTTTAIPTGTGLHGVSIDAGRATADLSSDFAAPGDEASLRLRAAQVVFTLTQFPSVDSVQLEVDGKPWSGAPGPVTRLDYELLAPAIVVESPAPGDTVRSPVEVRGTADTFEATVNVKLLDAAGKTVRETVTTATSGSGTRGTFAVSVPFSVGSPQAGMLLVFDYSAADGSVEHLVRVPLRLEP